MINVITAPTELPVTLAETKAALLVDHNADDALILTLIEAATVEAQTISGRSLVSRTVDLLLDRWPASNVIRLEYPPVVSVTSITYYNDSNIVGTMSSAGYITVLDATPPVIALAKDAVWPNVTLRPVTPIRVRYVCGYGTAAAVPARYKALIMALVAVDYENREGILPSSTTQRQRLQAALRMEWGYAT